MTMGYGMWGECMSWQGAQQYGGGDRRWGWRCGMWRWRRAKMDRRGPIGTHEDFAREGIVVFL